MILKYKKGENVNHPKFGEGIIEKIEQQSCSVSLHIRFGEELKVIDQKWLLQTKYKRSCRTMKTQVLQLLLCKYDVSFAVEIQL